MRIRGHGSGAEWGGIRAESVGLIWNITEEDGLDQSPLKSPKVKSAVESSTSSHVPTPVMSPVHRKAADHRPKTVLFDLFDLLAVIDVIDVKTCRGCVEYLMTF